MIVVYILGFLFSLSAFLYLTNKPPSVIRSVLKRSSNDQVYEDLKRLSFNADTDRRFLLFYKKKIKMFLGILMAGTAICIIMEICPEKNRLLTDNEQILRDEPDGKEKDVSLWATDLETGEKTRLSFTVHNRKYDEDTLSAMYSDLCDRLPKILQGDNPSMDYIVHDLDLVPAIEGLPFKLSYRSLDPLLLDSKGHIDKKQLIKRNGYENGILVNIQVTVTYEDFENLLSLYARVYEDTSEALNIPFSKALLETVTEAEKGSRDTDRLILPQYIGHDRVQYEETRTYKSLFTLILFVVAAVLLYKREDEELKKRIKDRNDQMLSDYPGIISKFSLFYSVGMTTRGILIKLCRDYGTKRENGMSLHYAYEEMVKTMQRMEEGVGECMAYEEFGVRCMLHKYRQLANLLEQTVIKGRKDTGTLLEEEAKNAFTERKNRARELGEKAGTKLLLPMFMMLSVVIIIIIMPAMSAIQM
ncbi:MAG: hypothetical protein K6G22_10060 [Lachnospiraceae bacterium]|nr:hypothetical protein [Lachnospiraceae bacterium]